MTTHRLHATAIAIEGEGVLFLGKSGVGKTDIALRLIEYGATLIGDDQVVLSVESGTVMASVDPAIAGIIELRGIGLIRMKYSEKVPLRLVVQCQTEAPERLPEAATYHVDGGSTAVDMSESAVSLGECGCGALYAGTSHRRPIVRRLARQPTVKPHC